MRVAGVYPQIIDLDPKVDPDPEEPLGIEYILGVARDHRCEVRLFVPLDEEIRELTNRLIAWSPDVVCLSLYTKHVPIGLHIAREIKRRSPRTTIVAGGPHPSADPLFIEHTAIDYVVVGEGEETFGELLRLLLAGGSVNGIRGLQFKEGTSRVVRTPTRPRIQNLDSIPFPLREPKFYSKPGYGLCSPPASMVRYAPIVYSRGCPLNCSFCSSPELWGRSVTYRSPQNTVDEMKLLAEEYGASFLFFEDLIFTVNRRKAIGLCEEIIRRNVRIHWACETSIRMVDNDLLSAMAQAGCTKIAYGIESLDLRSLREIHKKQDFDTMQRDLALTAGHGILTWAFYVIGFTWESRDDIEESTALLPELDIHQLRVTIATPYPGSPWAREFRPEDVNPDLSLYDTSWLVYQHPTISPVEMKQLQIQTCQRFYRDERYKRRVQDMCRRFPNLRESFAEFEAYLDRTLYRDGTCSARAVDRGDVSDPHSRVRARSATTDLYFPCTPTGPTIRPSVKR